MSKLSKAQANKLIHEAVKAILVDGENVNDTLDTLGHKGVDFSVLQNFNTHMDTIGKKEGWILTEEQIVSKVKKHLEGKTVSHFLDVTELAKGLNVGNLTNAEKQNYIISVSGVDASKVEESAQMKRLHNANTRYGSIYEWIRENPEFTPSELNNAGLNLDCKNRDDYTEEAITNRKFFFELYEKIHNIKQK